MAAKMKIFLTLEYVLFFVAMAACTTDYCTNFGTGHCICTDYFVSCQNERAIDNNIMKLYPYIKDNVREINITGSILTELPRSVFGSCKGITELILKRLDIVDLSDNKIKTIHGKTFHCMPALTKLILRNNMWQLDSRSTHVGYFTSLPRLKHLDLTNAFEEIWNGSYHIPNLVHVLNVTDLTHLETLSLASNEFFSFGAEAAASLCQMTALKTLDLSHNYLEKTELKDCMKNLTTLDLSHNKMPIISWQLRHVLDNLPNLQDVRLDHNQFQCDCGFVDTYRWLQETKAPINKDELRCAGGYYWYPNINRTVLSISEWKPDTNRAVLSMKESDLICQPSSKAVFTAPGPMSAVIAYIFSYFI